MNEYLQATKEIVLKAMELGKITSYTDTDPSKTNDNYLKELTKFIETVYQSVYDSDTKSR